MESKIIIHVLESLGAGTLTSCSQICNVMKDQGHDVHVIYSALRAETPDNLKDYFHEGVTLHMIDMQREISLLKDAISFFKIAAYFISHKPAVIHLHCSKAGVLGRAAALFYPAARVFYSPRGYAFLQEDLTERKRKVFWWIEQLFSVLRGRVIACSSSELFYAQKISKSSFLIENAIDEAKVAKKSVSKNKKIRVGTLGRVGYQKNPKKFSEIAKEITANSSIDIEFVWIGGGEEDMVEMLKCNGVSVTGWLERSEAIDILATLDIYLQTSLWEGMPLSVIEASMAGIPCVVTNVIGNRDVVSDNETGFVCDSNTDIVNAILKLYSDENMRVNMGMVSRNISIERFSIERLKNDYNAAYFS
jgi:glycosyltransferase involved in cell wall biosynthesis